MEATAASPWIIQWSDLQGSCAADLYRHPQLDADIEAVKDIYTDSAVSVRYDSTHTVSTAKSGNQDH